MKQLGISLQRQCGATVRRTDLRLSVLSTKQNPQKNTRKFLEVVDMFSILIVVMSTHWCMYISKVIKQCVRNMCNFLYTS